MQILFQETLVAHFSIERRILSEITISKPLIRIVVLSLSLQTQVFSYEERQFWFLHSFVTSISSFGIFYAGNIYSCV